MVGSSGSCKVLIGQYFPTDQTVSVEISTASNCTLHILPTLSDKEPHTTGLPVDEAGDPETKSPTESAVEPPTSILSPTSEPTSVSEMPGIETMISANIFAEPIDSGPPPSNIAQRDDHPVPRAYWCRGILYNPVGIQSLIMSAKELGQGTTLTTDSITAMSATVRLRPSANSEPAISFPLVQGMGTVSKATENPKIINNGNAEATRPFYGTIQIAKDSGGAEGALDQAAGVYPETVQLSGSVDDTTGSYSFTFFPAATSLRMQTTTKGIATGVFGTSWTMVEPRMPVRMGFAPYTPEGESRVKLSEGAKSAIRAAAQQEVSQNMIDQTNLDSMYFSGKGLAKFAMILYVINDMLEDRALAQAGLEKLKQAFATFVENRQQYPLLYERAWGGVVSSSTYTTGNSGMDFGNTYYNDHHFHWGYFVLAGPSSGI
ncbi:unnamed protein product [Parascedosporium putredinis]|uniref:glucan endo-1,3-beta-D-glucosidase n=1 Tax=Parascedosporium putredinis TaxID=1442378 RepID=A0A9P1HC95_9PEZI|nr:unnamed protein product [Parascedosporium putredinis]CAI8004692.1 unnamed protein product [Parascedosporium putredinis]